MKVFRPIKKMRWGVLLTPDLVVVFDLGFGFRTSKHKNDIGLIFETDNFLFSGAVFIKKNHV